MTTVTLGFLPIPREVAEQALTLSRPRDVAAFSQTCRSARQLVYNSPDQYLWRQLFLQSFDDPRNTKHGFRTDICFDWRSELQRRTRAENIARSPHSTPEDLLSSLQTFLDIVRNASPVTQEYERVPSRSLLWVVEILQTTNMLQLPPFTNQDTNQTLGRLRTYLALTLDEYDDDDEVGKQRLRALRTRSRCQVYDLRNYHRGNDWGPFMQQGVVDWMHVESVINVLLSNLADLFGEWMDTRPPCGLEATRAYSAPGTTDLPLKDWAGIQGNWRRYVSFMDYRDLFEFNFSGHARDASFFEYTHFAEATRLIELKLRLIEPHAVPHYYILDRFSDSKDPRYPTLYFQGSSWGIHGNEATVVGSVCMAQDGIVRWRFASVYEAHLQWSSEGVQIGGVASATGVVGTWTGAHHERADPVGPFWLWKVRDDHPSYMRAMVHG